VFESKIMIKTPKQKCLLNQKYFVLKEESEGMKRNGKNITGTLCCWSSGKKNDDVFFNRGHSSLHTSHFTTPE
jgi:hypothetical protein